MSGSLAIRYMAVQILGPEMRLVKTFYDNTTAWGYFSKHCCVRRNFFGIEKRGIAYDIAKKIGLLSRKFWVRPVASRNTVSLPGRFVCNFITKNRQFRAVLSIVLMADAIATYFRFCNETKLRPRNTTRNQWLRPNRQVNIPFFCFSLKIQNYTSDVEC